MEYTVKQRLIHYLSVKKISHTNFCRLINVSIGYISSMRVSIQPDKLKSIAINFPDLNIGWLLTGAGTMILSGKTVDTSEFDELQKENIELLRENRQLRIENNQLRSNTFTPTAIAVNT